MRFIFGLGNPGKKYKQTRHNAGFMFIDDLLEKIASPSANLNDKSKLSSQIFKKPELILAKPQLYMNRSGQVVQKVLSYFGEVEQVLANKNMIVVHDDLDLPLGKIKLQFGIGPQLHKGLNSIYSTLGSKKFWHLRIGVDDRQGDRTIPPEVYVLEKLDKRDLMQLDSVFKSGVQKLKQKRLL
jgi:PTH1 family peptidyl-tRNA hydrolase